MRPCFIPALTLFLARLIYTQTVHLLPSILPACASQCTFLTNAEESCTPPLSPVTSDQTYESCFCQSALLTSLYSSFAVEGVCPSCSAADMLTIQNWYQGVCPNAGKSAPNFGNLAESSPTQSSALQLLTSISQASVSAQPSTITGSEPSSKITTTSFSLSTTISSSPSPTGTSSGLPPKSKIGTGVGVPLGVVLLTGLIVLAYWFGQRKERTKSRHVSHSSLENESGRAMVDRDGSIHWIGFVPEIDGAEIPIHSRELEGSLGPRRYELPGD